VTASDDAQRGIRPLGVGVVLAGAVIVLASFRFLDWYDIPGQATDTTHSVTFSSLENSADQLSGATVTGTYFDWLGWLLLIALIVVGVGANVRSNFADPLRASGFVLGLLGAATTYLAMARYFSATGSDHNVFYNSSWGLWAALSGFVVGGVGAAIGPGRRA
jgi:hypothetical protein